MADAPAAPAAPGVIEETTPPLRPSSVASNADMMDFMRTNMSSILQPFADHVWQLQITVDDLTKALDTTNTNAANESQRLDDTRTSLDGLRSDLGTTNSTLEATRAALDQTNAEKAALQQDHEGTKAKLDSTEQKLQETVLAVEQLREALDATNAHAQKLENGLEETDKNAATLGANLEQAMQDISELRAWQETCTAELKQTWELAERTSHSLQKQSEIQENKRVADDAKHQEIDGRFKALDDRLNKADQAFTDQRNQVQANTSECQSLRQTSDLHTQEINSLKDQADTLTANLQDRTERLVKIEEAWWPYYDSMMAARTAGAGLRNVYEWLSELDGFAKKHTQDIKSIETGQHTQDYWIANADKRFADLQSKTDDHQRRLDNADQTFEMNEAKHCKLTETVDQHRADFDSAKDTLNQTIATLDATRNDVHDLREKLAETDCNVAANKKGLDRVNEYFNGMKKGLQASVPLRAPPNEQRDLVKTDLSKPVKLPALTPR